GFDHNRCSLARIANIANCERRTAVSESYSSLTDGSSPTLPELPEPPPERFQFSLKQLLAFMLGCALLAAAVRYVLQWTRQLPDYQVIGIFSTALAALPLGALLYFFLRGPALAYHAGRIWSRWNRVQKHRHDLERWTRERKQAESGGTESGSVRP